MTNALEQLRQMSIDELLGLGVKNVAYLKDVEVDGGTAVAIFAANGQQLALVPDRNTAMSAAWENGLSPMPLH